MATSAPVERLPSSNPKYPFVGRNYQQYGEQPGYIYYPWTDQYYIDPNAVQGYGEQVGIIKKPETPKAPSLIDTVLPIAAVGGAVGLGSALATNPGEVLSGITGFGDKVGGLLGLGGQASGATAATTGASGAAGLAGGAVPLAGGSTATVPLATPQVIGATRVPVAGAGGGLLDLGGIGGAGNALLPALGAIGAYDLFKNQRTGARGVAQGAASGAAIGSFFPGAGTLVGAGIGGLLGLGNSLFKSKDMWKSEGNRQRKLIEQGINIPESMREPMNLTSGRDVEDLIRKDLAPDFVGKDPTGMWVNNKFATSRSEKDLLPEDIMGYSTFAEKFGNDWWNKFSNEERYNIAQTALQSGAVNEHHGTVDVDWNKVKLPTTGVVQTASQVPQVIQQGPYTVPVPRTPAQPVRR